MKNISVPISHSKKKKFRKKRTKNFYLFRYILKSLFALFQLLIYSFIKSRFKNPNIYGNNNTYFACIANIGKFENLYAREFVEHYISLGVEKFYLMDDNLLNSEKLSDVLLNYIDKNIVSIIDNRGKRVGLEEFFEYVLNLVQYKCKWLLYFDYDEHLVFLDKNMTIKKFLSQKKFDKCDTVKFNWLIYNDNDLIHYDNRTLNERFTTPFYNTIENKFIKSIVRVKKYGGLMWSPSTGAHQPNESLVNICNSEGNLDYPGHGILIPPNYKIGYLKHYTMKTAEEYSLKLIRGEPKEKKNSLEEINRRIDRFFKHNKFTKEKLAIFEKKLNITLSKYHTK